MTTKQARVIVCDRRLLPSLPAIIFEIDGRLYIDIDSAAQDFDSFQREEASWRDDLFLLRWSWQYDQYKAKRYYLPSHQTIMVEWAISHGVNLNLGVKAAWEEVADTAFSPNGEEKARFGVDYGTYAVLEQAYLMSNYCKNPNDMTVDEAKEYFLSADEILSKKLATTEVYEVSLQNAPLRYKLQYKLYGLVQTVSRRLRRLIQGGVL